MPTSVFITGTAEYEIVSPLGTVRYPVKGGQVTLTVVDGASVTAGHTLVDGTFSGYVSALTEGNYTVIASVTDTTLTGQYEMTYDIPAANCPGPGGVVEQTGEISPKLPYATRNLFICNGDFFVRLPDCTTPVVAGSVSPGIELCLGINVHYFEINGTPIPEQPVYLTAYEQQDGLVIPHPLPGTAVSFVGGGSAEARFKWTPPHAGIFILQAQLNPTFPQGIEDDTATTTLVVGSPAEGATDIRVTAQGANLCGALYQNVSGRAVYSAQPGDARPVICGDVIVRGYVLDNNPDDPGPPQLIGVATGSTDRFGNFSIAPRIQFPPGNHLLVVEVSDGTLTGQYTIDVFCEPLPPPGEPSPDTPSAAPLDVFVYSEDIGFLGADCLSPLNRWPLPGETISLAANIHYYGPSPEPALPVDVNVLVPVGNQLIRQFIGRLDPVDWSQGGFLCLPWTPQILGPQIVEVATRPDLVPLDQFTGNDAATRLIFVGEVDCQLTAEPDRTTIEAGEMAEVSLTATRVSGEGAMELSVIYAGEGDVPPGMEVLLSSTTIAFSETVTFSVQTTEDVPPGLYRFILLGNGDTCQALATVNVRVVQPSDTTAPIISCPADLVVQCEADVPLPDVDSVEATDDPDPAPEVVHVGDEVSSLPTSTVILRTYRATDAAGNSAECVQTIIVQDTTPPAITCPQPVIVAADASCQAVLPDLRNASVVNDACTAAPDITVSQVPEPNTLLGLGEHLVTLTATDAAGNSATCTTTVTVRDETAPSIVCPASVTLVADANCQAALPDLTTQAQASDCNDPVAITQLPAAGALLALGVHNVTLTATDATGNTETCTTTVTVVDETQPEITCPQPVQLIADAHCQATVPDLAALAQASDCSGNVIVTQSPAAGTPVGLGNHTVELTATDAAGNTTSCTLEVAVVDQTPPAFACPDPVQLPADENGNAPTPDFLNTLAATDNCSATVTASQSPVAGSLLSVGTHEVLITVTAEAGNQATCTVAVTVSSGDNTAPVVTIEQPESGFLSAVNQGVQFQGTFTDDGPVETHSAQWVISSATLPETTIPGTVNGFTVTDTIQFPEPGVYSIKLVVTDAQGESGEATKVLNDLPAYVVVYDPEGGFVTGGGWIWSPAGAFHPGLAEFEPVEGKANFGFVSKYKPGSKVPTGQTQFNFHAGGLNFHSGTYQWLVVAGARAQYKGTGTINNSGHYGFMLTAIDGRISGGGDQDRFRIKIWDNATGVIVYDNQPASDDDAELNDATILRGGSIVIHKR